MHTMEWTTSRNRWTTGSEVATAGGKVQGSPLGYHDLISCMYMHGHYVTSVQLAMMDSKSSFQEISAKIHLTFIKLNIIFLSP